jgi:hypothetical protein
LLFQFIWEVSPHEAVFFEVWMDDDLFYDCRWEFGDY